MLQPSKRFLCVVLSFIMVPMLLFAAPPHVLNSGNAQISGKVTDLNGIPLSGITVEARQQVGQGWPIINTNQTDAAGAYTVGGLPDGGYVVAFDDPAGTYARKLYEGTLLVYNARTFYLNEFNNEDRAADRRLADKGYSPAQWIKHNLRIGPNKSSKPVFLKGTCSSSGTG